MYTERSLQQLAIAKRWRKTMAATANYGFAQSTWSAYRTAAKILEKCANSTGTNMGSLSWEPSPGVRLLDAGQRLLEQRNGQVLTWHPPGPSCQRSQLALPENPLCEASAGRKKTPGHRQKTRWLGHSKTAHNAIHADAAKVLVKDEVLCRKESFFDPHCTLLGRDTWIKKSQFCSSVGIQRGPTE